MNIGIDAHMLGHNETGNETYIYELVRAIATRKSSDTFFIYVEDPAALPPSARAAHNVCVKPYATRSGMRRLTYELASLAGRDRLDVLHVSYNAPLRLPPQCALVVTIHDISFEHFPDFFSRSLRTFLKASVPRSARAAEQVITDTESAKRDLVATYRLAPDRITVTHYAAGAQFQPLDDAKALSAVRRKYGTGEQFLLAVGNLQPRKNWTRLIRAFAEVQRSYNLPHKLVIAGQRLWREAPILEAAQALSERVVLTGYVPAEDLPLLYNAAEAFAYPSLYEGFGLPVLEAMACGTPVLTSNVSALPEIAGNAAHLVNPYLESELAAGLAQLLTDAAYRAELRARGLKHARGFAWERTALQTLNVYHAAARSKRARVSAALA